MNNLATILFGPLCGPECRRALVRGWLILVRCLAAIAIFFVALIAYWVWWLQLGWDGYYKLQLEIKIGQLIVEGMMVTIAMILGPALMAGSLAGEKERGVLALLLTTRMRSREIVTGRLVGKLTQVGMILLAGLPAIAWLGGLSGVSPGKFLIYILLPVSVALGGCGLAAVASTLSRRGRDALLSVYLIDLFFMLTPLGNYFGVSTTAFGWFAGLNPFTGLSPLVFEDYPTNAWISSLLWIGIGLLGVTIASWRLRPSCLAPLDGERVGGRSKRPFFVPPVNEIRPMLWKELYIERVGTLGRFGRYAGMLLVLALGGGTIVLTAMLVTAGTQFGSYDLAEWSIEQLERWIGGSGILLTCLIQWAIGLRAAVSISSERERGTWDALLTSPLDAGSIVRAKVWGSLYAIRWLIIAAFVAWILGAGAGAITVYQAVDWGLGVLIVGAFMAAVGVRTSLTTPTATRAMSITIGVWLGSVVASRFIGALLMAAGFILVTALWLALTQLGLTGPRPPVSLPMILYYGWPIALNLAYLIATILVVIDTRIRFDRLAGRMTEGDLAVAVDDLIYGRPADEYLPEGSPHAFGAEPRVRT